MAAERRSTILNVDDYGPSRYSRSRTLRSAGFDVIEASNGRDALASLHEHKPQLVVLDVNLPDMSGIEVCRKIKQDPATAHVLVLHLSATSTGVENKVEGLASGCDGYLTEPVEAEELVAHVNALLRLKRAEEELRETNATMRTLFDALPLAVIATDREGCVTRWSPSAARVFGWSEQDVLGGPNPAIPPHVLQEYGERVRRTLAGESVVGFVTLMLRKNGTTVPVSLSLGPLRTVDGNVSGALAVIEDITARKESEREMARLYQEAGRAGRVKDEFLATLSHELRTPLNAMRVWVHLLRRGEVPPDRVDSALEIIDRNTTAQVRLIEDILDVSRIVSGKLRLQYLPVDLRRVVAAAADMVRPVAAAKHQELNVGTGDQAVLVMGDHQRLQQVVTNLLSNAVKFTPAGGRVAVSVDAEGQEAAIEVHDTGVGIDAKFLPHVFERFAQADSTSSRAHGGLGLGLAIVSHLVELHGGGVQADSPGLGQGSTFRVTLPLNAAVSESPAVPHKDLSADLQGLDVLVVDDDVDAREPLEMLLTSRGARVRVASSTPQAIEAYTREAPHVLIADLGMPGEDGFALLRRLTALDPGFPVYAIALSGYVGEEDRARAYRAGFHEHLAKPLDVSGLMTTLARAVEQRRLRKGYGGQA
jgi:PAS domain S-box-containing protein